jgi:tetratricopeptide (TPR) repeat protein
LIGFIARFPSLQGQLVWDDQYLARDNPLIKSPLFVFEVFRHYLFLDSYSPHYRPVQNVSFMVDYFLWNTDTFGFHLTNVLLHVAGGILLYFLLRRLLGSLPGVPKTGNQLVAFAVAGVWVVHPVHSAAVDYISGRADSLAFVFASAGWLLFLKAPEMRTLAGRIAFFLASAVLALAALCSRETACVWTALFILNVLLFDRRSWRLKTVVVTGCILLVGFYAGLRQLPDQHIQSPPGPHHDFALRGVLMLRALGDYTRLLVFPSNLHMERTVIEQAAFQDAHMRERLIGFEYLSLLGLGSAGAIALLAFKSGPGAVIRRFGALWFLVAFLPVSNLFDLNATVAEHWMYLPSVGFFIFLAGCAPGLPKTIRNATPFAVIAVILALGTRSFVRSTDWSDPETFYERTANAGGVSCRIGVNLGHVYSMQGQYDKAEKIFRNVLKLQPDYTIARNNLADVLAHLGREQEGTALLEQATKEAEISRRAYPRTWVAALNYAHVLFRAHDYAATQDLLDKARRDYPDTWELIAAESELFRTQGNFDASISLVRPYAEKRWWHYESWMALGRVLAEKAEVDLAEEALRHASRLDIHSTDAFNLIAVMRMGQNRFEDARQAQARAVARQPDQPRQYVLLSNILERMGRNGEAQQALAQVDRLRTLASTEKTAN